jgi:acetolactate synthase-1/3 small subunit
MRHIIAILLQNEAGALSRVAGLFSTRGYNIESLSVAPTDDPTVSRLTLVTTGRGDHFERELLLLKLKVVESQLEALTALVTDAGGRILSGSLANFVIELTSSEAQVSRFLAQASQRGEVLEVVRSGALGIMHGGATLKLVHATA